MYVAKVNISRSRRALGVARCQGCSWSRACVRERARAHVKTTGHTVDYTVSEITTYSPLRGAQ